jgi:hypothetical protein
MNLASDSSKSKVSSCDTLSQILWRFLWPRLLLGIYMSFAWGGGIKIAMQLQAVAEWVSR